MNDNKNNIKNIKILNIDPYLKPFEKDIKLRVESYKETKKKVLGSNQNFKSFANGDLFYGFHLTGDGWVYREWAPKADALYLIGDFNCWDPKSHPLQKKENGNWEIYLDGAEALKHMSHVKVRVVAKGVSMDRMPLYIKRTIQDPITHDFKDKFGNRSMISNGRIATFMLITQKHCSYMRLM